MVANGVLLLTELVVMVELLTELVLMVELLPKLDDIVAVGDAVEEHDTAVGRSVTPFALQMESANVAADAWSAASQLAARQHAIVLKKLPLEQMQLISTPLQPAMLVPWVNAATHESWMRTVSISIAMRRKHNDLTGGLMIKELTAHAGIFPNVVP